MATAKSPEFWRSLQAAVEGCYEAAPWKIIPGPWAMKICVHSPSHGNLFRVGAIVGASNADNRGLNLNSTLVDYAMGINRSAVLFKRFSEFPPHRVAEIKKFLSPVDKKKQYPLFLDMHDFSMIGEEDLIFFESALRAVGTFISEAARLGGCTYKGMSTEHALSAEEVLASVVDKGTYEANFTTSAPSLAETFPCVQTVDSFFGPVTVTIHVELTSTALAQTGAISRPIHPSAYADPNIPPPNPEATRKCIVCGVTESDLRSRGGGALKRCSACDSPTDRYCSVVCQKEDWKRHKKSCTRKK